VATYFAGDDNWETGSGGTNRPVAAPPSRELPHSEGHDLAESDQGEHHGSAHWSESNLMGRVAVAVVERDPDDRAFLLGLLGGVNGVNAFATLDELTGRLTGSPLVVVLGPSIALEGGFPGVERLIQQHSELGAVLVTHELSTAVLQQALRAGVRDVLTAPLSPEQLYEAVERVSSGLRAPSVPLIPKGVDIDPLESGGDLGRVVTVFSTKGGAGKSVIATNLGVVLAMRSDRPVCLVDADLQFGDIAVMLKLAPAHTIVDAVNSLDRLDTSLLQSLLTFHPASGMLVLAAPLEPAFADQIGAADMVRIIELLRRFCSFVIVDTPAYFNDVVLGLIEVSDEVLLVAGLDVPNIKKVKIGLQTLRLLNTPREKLRLILNRANSKAKLDVSEVERTLQVTADSLIPSDVVVPQSVNKGIPVVLSAPRSSVAKAMEELADLYLPADSRRKRR
jgi:pilus assembly protein CpaE